MVSPNLQMDWHFVDVRSNHCINWMEGMMLNMKSNTQPAATQLQKLMEFDRKLFSYTGADNTFKILRYMPVSAKNYVLARMKYVFRFFWKMTAIMTVIQIIISVAAKNFVIENYIYVFCCFMIIPMSEAGIELLITVGLIRNAR